MGGEKPDGAREGELKEGGNKAGAKPPPTTKTPTFILFLFCLFFPVP